MIIKHNIDISDICWLAGSYEDNRCYARHYYIPETTDELQELCHKLYKEHGEFDLIGHTSNIYFKPGYNTENLVSTRKLTKWEEKEDYIWCECGVNVKALAREMVEKGIEGFAGLVDLPGTVGAGIYGNAGCFGDEFSKLVISVMVLKKDGCIIELSGDEMGFSKRSSVLKRHIINGVIISAKLRKVIGDKIRIEELAKRNHNTRKSTQPGPKNNLGSIFKYRNELTLKGRIVKGLSAFIAKLTNPNMSSTALSKKKTVIACRLLNKDEISEFIPYGFNRYIWSSYSAHEYFDSYISLYKEIFKNAELEIEIKQ